LYELAKVLGRRMFDQVLVRSEFTGAVHVPRIIRRGEHDKLYVIQLRLPAGPGEDIMSAQARHLHVKEHHAGKLFIARAGFADPPEISHGLITTGAYDHWVEDADPVHLPLREKRVIGIIIDDHNWSRRSWHWHSGGISEGESKGDPMGESPISRAGISCVATGLFAGVRRTFCFAAQ
jgi:hypothetical protein